MTGEGNRAAWLSTRLGKPLEVKEAPMPSPQPHELVIRVRVAAVNPIDWMIQDIDGLAGMVKDYPWIPGIDGAGEVVSVGSAVTKFAAGDRVLTMFEGLMTQRAANSGFQLFAAANAANTARLPAHIDFTHAAVLPLAVSAAAAGLYQADALALRPFPSVTASARTDKDDDEKKNEEEGEGRDEGSSKAQGTLVVWGAAGSVGSATVQLARASGLRVVATASARNFGFVRGLGAAEVFDYASPTVVDDVVKALEGRRCVGVYDAVSKPETAPRCVEIARRFDEGNRFVVILIPDLQVEVPDGVKTGRIFAENISMDEVGPAVWGGWVESALASGQLQCKPDPFVAGKGLESFQAAMQMSKEGVSASKVVVELP